MSRQHKDRASGKISVLPLQATSISERISTSITASKVPTCVAGLFPQPERCAGHYDKQCPCFEVHGACNACKPACLYDTCDCGYLCRGKRQHSFPSSGLCSRSSTLQRRSLQLKYAMLLLHLSRNGHAAKSGLAVDRKSKPNWPVQDGCRASFQVCNSGIAESSTRTKKMSECQDLGFPFREDDSKWSPKPGSLQSMLMRLA